jgi:hypothetical protein
MDVRTVAVNVPLDSLDANELTGLLGQVEALRFRILSRLCPATPAPAAAQPVADARMLDIAETARRIGMSRSWLYRNASKLAFARRISNRWRFDTRGLEKYLRDRQAS